MKSRIIKLLSVPLSLSILLSGCSSDVMPPAAETPVDKDTDFYMNVVIATPSEGDTRADGDDANTNASSYVDGTAEEQKIHKILFVFYNSVHEYVGNAHYTPSSDSEQSGVHSGTIESVLNLTVPVTVAAGSTKPAYVMAYVNPTNKAENDLFTDYYTALGAMRTLDDVRDSENHPGFAMNNSVHYEAEQTSEYPRIAVPIDPDKQLFATAKQANEAGPESSVVIYVERIVAKVKLDRVTEGFSEEDNTIGDAVTANKKYILKFDFKGWGLSNLERRTFLVKNFRHEDYNNPTIDDNPMIFQNFTYGELDGRLKQAKLTNPHWNFPGNNNASDATWGISGHRSFWALSPTYYNKNVQIPKYADDIYYADNANQAPYVHDSKSSLIYHTFDEIYDIENEKLGPYGRKLGHTSYTLEHTMQASLITDYQKRAVTCALVVGKYRIYEADTDGNKGDEVDYDHFYIRKRMTEDSHVSEIFVTEKALKTAYLNANTTIFTKNGNDYNPVRLTDDNITDFVIDHPRHDITGETSVASRYVTIRLANPGTNKYYYKDADGTWTAITNANLLDANRDLYVNMIGAIGGVEIYYNGYAYFEVPIRHLWGRDNPGIGEDGFKLQLGQYGIVRNHCYNINVEGIKGIGLGVSDPGAPVVPNVDNDDYVVKSEIRVQRWRVVPTQDVTLKP